MSGTNPDTKFARLKWRRAFINWERSAARWVEAIKAGYDPNQPRHPEGSSEGGRWSGGGSGGTRIAQANSGKPKKTPRKEPKQPELKIPAKKTTRGSKEPLGPQPKISKRKPATVREQNRMVKQFTKWADQARKVLTPSQIKILQQFARGIPWLKPFYPVIQSYFDAPKSLDQLNRDAQTKRPGYERHHIVEQTPARKDGFRRDLIDAPENIVSVPKYKHEDISGHYQKKNPKFGDKSLRNHLRGKSWEERRNEGLRVLEEFGVLGP